MPRGTRKGQIEEALHKKAAWILKTLRRLEAPPPLAEGRELAFMGQTLKLHLSANMAATVEAPRVALMDETLTVNARESDWENQELLRAALEGWFRRRARELIPARLALANRTFGFPYGRVAVKEQKSRWGSCSRAGNLNFNWRLLLAPLPVLDYVLIHELAHLKSSITHQPSGNWSLRPALITKLIAIGFASTGIRCDYDTALGIAVRCLAFRVTGPHSYRQQSRASQPSKQ